MKTIMSVDLEGDWDSKKTKNVTKIVPKLLNLFDKHKITSTFFIVGEIVKKYPDLIKEISKKHEIASHGQTHSNLKKLSDEELEKEVSQSKKEIEKLGIKCIGFRAPFLIKPKNLSKYLKKYGYVYDSSLAASLFPGRYFNLSNKPFFDDGILEIPVSNLKIPVPFSLSYVRLFYPLSMSLLPKKPVMFYLHTYEFLKEKPGKEIPFYVRQLVKINRGEKAWKIFENLIEKTNSDFISCKDYIKQRYKI